MSPVQNVFNSCFWCWFLNCNFSATRFIISSWMSKKTDYIHNILIALRILPFYVGKIAITSANWKIKWKFHACGVIIEQHNFASEYLKNVTIPQLMRNESLVIYFVSLFSFAKIEFFQLIRMKRENWQTLNFIYIILFDGVISCHSWMEKLNS